MLPSSTEASIQYLFIASILMGLAYYAWRWRIDPLAVGFGSCLVYFSPGLFGVTSFYYTSGVMYRSEIDPKAYAVMLIVLAALVATTLAYDRFAASTPGRSRIGVISASPSFQYVPHVLLAVAVVAAGRSFFTTGAAYFCDKATMLTQIDGWYYMATYAGVMGFGAGLASRVWWVPLTLTLLVAGVMLIGFRDPPAIVIIAAALLYGESILHSSLPKRILAVALIAMLATGLFVYKELAYGIKRPLEALCPISAKTSPSVVHPPQAPAPGTQRAESRGGQQMGEIPSAPPVPKIDWSSLDAVLAQLRNPNTYLAALTASEPTVIQATLNEVVRKDFQTPSAYLWRQLASIIPGVGPVFPSLIWRDIPLFNDLFQPVLFPDAKFGMASNLWAQAFAAQGFLLVAVFALGYAGVLSIMGHLIRLLTGPLRGIVAVFAAWWAFYIHRNDLMIELGILKMSAIIAVIAIVASWVIWRLQRRLISKASEPLNPFA